MHDMQRIMVFDRLDAYVCDIDPAQVLSATVLEEVNGEHSLTLTTLQEFEQTDRLLLQDGMGTWHEYVVLGIKSERPQGEAVAREYYCVWSIQYDLSATYINDQLGCGVVPGHTSVPQTPRRALECALAGTSRWQIGTITVTTQAAASFYRRSGWEGLQTVIERWGGELQATIEVSLGGVTARSVDLLEHVGRSDATRRFDYGHDLAKIKQTVHDEVWPCRIVPLGKSVETEAGGYTRRPGIESVNDGVEWLQDDEVAPLVRVPDGDGGWEYPTAIVKNDTYELPADLKAWAVAHIGEYTRPRVTYEANVAQFAQAGLDPHGVALGDEVACVDRTFCEGGLRITARVVKIKRDLLDPSSMELTIGNAQTTLAGQLSAIAGDVTALGDETASASDYQASAAYMAALVGRLNDEINASGGYWYIVPGIGTRTYDVPVSDPAVGAEASKVVEVRGGTIRIADSRTSSGDWDWTNVFTADGINSELVRAVQIEAGYIGDLAGSGNYWDLDTGEFRLASTANLGGKTVQQVIDGVDATITGVDVQYAQNQSATTAPTSGWSTTAPAWREGYYIWQRTATTTPEGTDYSTPVMISGRDGTNGVGISSTTISYGTSASASTQPTNWSQTAPTSIAKGTWLWVRTVTAYTDGSSKTAYTKAYQGDDGTNGNGISSTTIRYGTSDSAATQPTSWSATAPTTIATGKWLWTRTVTSYTDGTSTTAYSKAYVGTNGTNGRDGTSVTIKGSYNTYADLIAAHPTGSDGDAYMVGTDLYVWNGSAWEDVGQIQGPPGPAGQNGTSVTVTAIEYGTSTSATAQPDSWSTTAPTSLAKGTWLWVRTTYSDGGSATTKSYVGTDGEDGASVYVQSATKVDDVTTVVIADTDGHTNTLTITDGTDGTNGLPGTNGLNGYVHVAWATSADGSQGFSTTVSGGKTYLGTYTDNIAADSQRYQDYSWSLIKGADGKSVFVQSVTKVDGVTTVVLSDGTTQSTLTIDDGADGPRGLPGTNGTNSYVHIAWANSADGTEDFSTTVSAGKSYLGVYSDEQEDDSTDPADYSWSRIEGQPGQPGADGVGITSIVEQYYLSTSSGTQSGGSWVTTPPAYVAGRYYWTRSVITWDDGTTTITSAVLSRGLNSANSTAAQAKSTAESAQSDVDALSTQDAIFNLLTDNGTIQGLYMQDGQLYVNASYLRGGYINGDLVRGGTIAAGGADNVNGIIQVQDANGNVISQLDKDGATLAGNSTLVKRGIRSAGTNLAQELRLCHEIITSGSNYYLVLTGYVSSIQYYIYGTRFERWAQDNSSSDLTKKNDIIIVPSNQTGSQYHSSIAATDNLRIISHYEELVASPSSSSVISGQLDLKDSGAQLGVYTGNFSFRSRVQVLDGEVNVRVDPNKTAHALTISKADGITMRLATKMTNDLTVSGTKSRLAQTEHYGDRLLYAYETPAPMFGDLGSGTIGEDGTCYVQVDDIFGETVSAAMEYQVFLQKCGPGDLWVAEKRPGWFVVEGTPGLAFDWELKAHQAGYEYERLEDDGMQAAAPYEGDDIEAAYAEDMAYAEAIERLQMAAA